MILQGYYLKYLGVTKYVLDMYLGTVVLFLFVNTMLYLSAGAALGVG